MFSGPSITMPGKPRRGPAYSFRLHGSRIAAFFAKGHMDSDAATLRASICPQLCAV
jgi:hypothetical protein